VLASSQIGRETAVWAPRRWSLSAGRCRCRQPCVPAAQAVRM